MPETLPMGDVELLKAAIEASGMSAREFAVKVLVRDERTVRRWVNRDGEIPKVVADFLREYMQKGDWRK